MRPEMDPAVSGPGSPAHDPVGEAEGDRGAPRHFPKLVAEPPDRGGRLRLLSDVRLTEGGFGCRPSGSGPRRFEASWARHPAGRKGPCPRSRPRSFSGYLFQVSPKPDRNQGFAGSGSQFPGSRLSRIERLQDLQRPFPPQTSGVAGQTGLCADVDVRPCGVG